LLDAYAWRTPAIEMAMFPQNLIPGIHIVGSLFDNWGSVYPRTGFIQQPADAKAAAVIAERAADIATQANQPHVYNTLPSGSCGHDCTVNSAQENNSNTQWQMVYPIEETTCSSFGQNDLASPTPWGSDAAQQGNGNYTWILWRQYQGCIQVDGKFLGSS
jgi:integrating conjugative element protein (TIGR03756 family)